MCHIIYHIIPWLRTVRAARNYVLRSPYLCLASMPGKHSAEKLQCRRARAIAKGFLVAHSGGPAAERKKIEVSATIAPRIKAVAKSLELQKLHNELSGHSCSIARLATLAAKADLPKEDYSRAMATHNFANSAKHCWSRDGLHALAPTWADTVDDPCKDGSDCASDVTTGGACGRPLDPVYINDPWASAASFLPCSSPNSSLVAPCLRANAETFTPASPDVAGACPGVEETSFSSALALVESQNHTIALLSGELDVLKRYMVWPAPPPSRGDLPSLEKRLVALEAMFGASDSKATENDGLPGSTKFATLEVVKEQADDMRTLICNVSDSVTHNVNEMVMKLCGEVKDSCMDTFTKIVDKLKALHSELEDVRNSCKDARDRLCILEKCPSAIRTLCATPSGVSCSHVSASSSCTAGRPDVQLQPRLATPNGDFGNTFFVGDHVRLRGLETVALNEKCGVITDLAQSSKRFGVQLVGESGSKAVLASNLIPYETDPNDNCPLCHEWFNLNAFPPCCCVIGSRTVETMRQTNQSADSSTASSSGAAPTLQNRPSPTTPCSERTIL